MAAWRRKAIEQFPELRRELNDSKATSSPYALWFELLPLAVEAHQQGSDDVLRRIYGYAAWSCQQKGDLRNAVCVSFYEHLFDEPWMRPLVVPWLNAAVITDVRPLWAARLAPDDLHEVEKLLRGQLR
jgi:hypothetical protein